MVVKTFRIALDNHVWKDNYSWSIINLFTSRFQRNGVKLNSNISIVSFDTYTLLKNSGLIAIYPRHNFSWTRWFRLKNMGLDTASVRQGNQWVCANRTYLRRPVSQQVTCRISSVVWLRLQFQHFTRSEEFLSSIQTKKYGAADLTPQSARYAMRACTRLIWTRSCKTYNCILIYITIVLFATPHFIIQNVTDGKFSRDNVSEDSNPKNIFKKEGAYEVINK